MATTYTQKIEVKVISAGVERGFYGGFTVIRSIRRGTPERNMWTVVSTSFHETFPLHIIAARAGAETKVYVSAR